MGATAQCRLRSDGPPRRRAFAVGEEEGEVEDARRGSVEREAAGTAVAMADVASTRMMVAVGDGAEAKSEGDQPKLADSVRRVGFRFVSGPHTTTTTRTRGGHTWAVRPR